MQTQTITATRPTRQRALRRLVLEITPEEPIPDVIPVAHAPIPPLVSDSGAVVEIIQSPSPQILSAVLSITKLEAGQAHINPKQRVQFLAERAKDSIQRAKNALQASKNDHSPCVFGLKDIVLQKLRPAHSSSDRADIKIRDIPAGEKAIVELFPMQTDPAKQKQLEEALKKVEDLTQRLEAQTDLSKVRFCRDGLTASEALTFVTNFFAGLKDQHTLAEVQIKTNRNFKSHTELKIMASDDRGIELDEEMVSKVHKMWSLMKFVLEHKHLGQDGAIFFTVLANVQTQIEGFGSDLQHFDAKIKSLKEESAIVEKLLKEKAKALSLADLTSLNNDLDEVEKTIRTQFGI